MISRRVTIPSDEDVVLIADTDPVRTTRAVVQFVEAGTVYLGPPGVTSADGYRWDGAPFDVHFETYDELRARAASGTIEADVLIFGATE